MDNILPLPAELDPMDLDATRPHDLHLAEPDYGQVWLERMQDRHDHPDALDRSMWHYPTM